LIGEDNALSSASSYASSIQKKLNETSSAKPSNGFISPEISLNDEIIREGWSTNSAVSFVSLAFKTVRMKHEDAPRCICTGRFEKKAAHTAVFQYITQKTAFFPSALTEIHI